MLILWLEKESEGERETIRRRESAQGHLTRDGSAGSAKWQHQICEILEGSLIVVRICQTQIRLLKAEDVQRSTSYRLGSKDLESGNHFMAEQPFPLLLPFNCPMQNTWNWSIYILQQSKNGHPATAELLNQHVQLLYVCPVFSSCSYIFWLS